MAMNNVTIEQMMSRWDSNERPLFKGKLIDENGCCCAQGDVLRCAGYRDSEIRRFLQGQADEKVAELLGITRAESILLRAVNDKMDGCPQDVFRDREKILGKHHKLWLAFVLYLEKLPRLDRNIIRTKYPSGPHSYNYDFDTAFLGIPFAKIAADIAADIALEIGTLAGSPIDEEFAIRGAAYELLGWGVLDKPHYLCAFFDDPAAWVKEHE